LATALCDGCGEAMGMESARFEEQLTARMPAEGLLCTACRLAPPAFARAVAYGVYDDAMRELVHLLKYERMLALAKPLGEFLADAVMMLEGTAGRELTVVAVPLFSANERTRGYNQSALLADAAIKRLKARRPSWALRADHAALTRVRPTESQFGLTPRGRRRNLAGAFAADPARVMNREVLLIDDIYTTGATARECSRVLRRAGARTVWVATLARAQREQVALWEDDG
jgi:ComF family protein